MLLWSVVYLLLQMHEINDGNDEGLINLKQEFVIKANTAKGFVENMEQNTPLNLIVTEISTSEATQIIEHFETTKVYFATELEEEEVRMFTSAFYCELNDKHYKIQFFTSTVETDDMIKNILYLTFGLWIILIITLIILSKIIISRANKPFYKLLDELKRFRLDNSKNIVFPNTKVTEYIQLNEAVNELISKNINIFTEQKEFIENCSHELQTPIAVAIAKLELLIEKYRHDITHIQELTELISILNRMKRLNSSLLLLSKIKNNQFTNLQQVNLNEELKKSLDELSDFIEYKEITVSFDNKKTIEKEMNADLIHILFTNMLKNAITHNEQGGKIDIQISQNQIIISNSGTTEIKNIFSRYNANQVTANSTGLGLSIVKSIADLYKIHIEYRFADSKHIFSLNF
jgi:signal transduction histidine kinase